MAGKDLLPLSHCPLQGAPPGASLMVMQQYTRIVVLTLEVLSCLGYAHVPTSPPAVSIGDDTQGQQQPPGAQTDAQGAGQGAPGSASASSSSPRGPQAEWSPTAPSVVPLNYTASFTSSECVPAGAPLPSTRVRQLADLHCLHALTN